MMNSQPGWSGFSQQTANPGTPSGLGLSLENRTPASATSSTNTYLLPASPSKRARSSRDGYKPKIARTCGQRPACLVNASVTYCGSNQIYAFGGFDQYTDEVYNHVLKLDLDNLQWTLVDNYGDIPGVRMGHTASLWQGSKLLVYGGENEHREYLSDLIIYDLKTSHWTQPEIKGPIPKGRARHAAAVFDDKLFIVGGLAGSENSLLDEICFLDLVTMTWSRSWSFVARFDHSTWIWGGRIWVYGGLGLDMERPGELWSLDLKGSPAFKSVPVHEMPDVATDRLGPRPRTHLTYYQPQQAPSATSGYSANSSSLQIRSASAISKPVAPGAISSTRFISGPNVPSPAQGTHFHVCSSGALLDFVTPAGSIRSSETNLSALDLGTQQWQRLAEGQEIFDLSYRWHYCAINEDGTKAWLLGHATEPSENGAANLDEFLSDVVALDLREYGLLGNELSWEPNTERSKSNAHDPQVFSKPSTLGTDLGLMFDKTPGLESDSDFLVTAIKDDTEDEDEHSSTASSFATTEAQQTIQSSSCTSKPIHVHRLILQARWPYFNRMYNAQMSEFHTKKVHIQEPYRVVRAFLYYLYTDSIEKHPEYCPGLAEVAGLLVMSDVYDMPELRLHCVRRLSRELDVEHAAVVWERAGTAGEEWLRRRAASYCLVHWGRVVRTDGFKNLNQRSMIELLQVVDVDGRIIGGEELEVVGGFGGGKIGVGGSGVDLGRRRARGRTRETGDENDDNEVQEDEGMEIN